MPTDIMQLLINSSGAAIVTALFIWYLIKRDRTGEKQEERFNLIIQDYLRDNLTTHKELAKRLQEFADASNYHTAVIREQKGVLEKVYKELYNKKLKIERYEKGKATTVASIE